jgi:hypothetical protein
MLKMRRKLLEERFNIQLSFAFTANSSLPVKNLIFRGRKRDND